MPRASTLLEPTENDGLGLYQESYGWFTLTNDGVTLEMSEEQARWVARMLTGALAAARPALKKAVA